MTSDRLSDRLDELKRQRARTQFATDLEVIADVRVSADDFLTTDAGLAIKDAFYARVKAGAVDRQVFLCDGTTRLQRALARLSASAGDRRVVMLEEPNGLVFAVWAPAAPIISAALEGLVSRARDLALTTPDAANGLLVGLDHHASGDEYEIISWGAAFTHARDE